MARYPTAADKLKREHDAATAVELRIQGKTYQQIANALGVSDGWAFRLVSEELERRRTETAEKTELLRAIEMERLESWLDKLYPNIETGDCKSIQTAVKIQERKSKLLGLDAAIDVAVKAESLDDNTLIARLREAIGTGTPGSSNPPPSGG